MNITISDRIIEKCPKLSIGVIECELVNSDSNLELWAEIEMLISNFRAKVFLENINKIPTILATRKAYKALGKDPNRYRPSAEALCRRVVKEMDLYRINTMVDLINLVSIQTGYSIGGFDAELIQGDLELGVGTKEDEFSAIGRGLLNIEGLPVYRDDIGGIGTPTSDEERTKITLETTKLLMIINAYSGLGGLHEAISLSKSLLQKYVSVNSLKDRIISCK